MNIINVNGKEYYTQQEKRQLITTSTFVKIEMVIYFKKTGERVKLYDKEVVDKYHKNSRSKKKDIYISKFANDNHLKVLKDYTIFNMSVKDIAKKYKISKQRVHQILDKHIDPVKKDLTINE
jgi:predicted DNA-binding protein YlxM (UPF0122 family)